MKWLRSGIQLVTGGLFGGQNADGTPRNVVTEIAEVFTPNAERQAEREASSRAASLAQFAAEFQHERKGWFDRLIDGLNRLPRPMMALGVIALFVSAMYDPLWFAARMSGLATVPEPLWWLLGAIVSFYFGARAQSKGMEFRQSVAESVAMVQAAERAASERDESAVFDVSALADEADRVKND